MVCVNSLLGTLRKIRRQWQRERHQTKGLMSKTIAVHEHYNSGTFLWRPLQNSNVKLPNSTLSVEREPQRLLFRISIWK